MKLLTVIMVAHLKVRFSMAALHGFAIGWTNPQNLCVSEAIFGDDGGCGGQRNNQLDVPGEKDSRGEHRRHASDSYADMHTREQQAHKASLKQLHSQCVYSTQTAHVQKPVNKPLINCHKLEIARWISF